MDSTCDSAFHELTAYLLKNYNKAKLSLDITTDGQSASMSWNKAPIYGLLPDFYYCCELMWGALSDERIGLSFTIAAGPRQRSHFRVRVSWDSLQYLTVSDSRLFFSSPPTTRRATVDVFEPASTRVNKANLESYVCEVIIFPKVPVLSVDRYSESLIKTINRIVAFV
jgi:hypothetical protein